MGQGIEAEFVSFPNSEKIIDLACAAHFMVALGESGNVFYWGRMQVCMHETDNLSLVPSPCGDLPHVR